MSTYQGHLNDGSSVQKHSAGGLYPYVIFAKDTPSGLRYGVLCPSGYASELRIYGEAVDIALFYKANGIGR